MLRKLKQSLLIIIVSVVVIGLFAISGSGIQTASADAKDNLTKSSMGIVGGWSEVVIYPAQKASEPGLLGKVMLPTNIVIGAVKGAFREVAGAVDFLTFFKGRNIVDSYPGDDL